MRVACLGSGSGGNAILVEGDGGRLLLDAGFSSRDLTRRLHQVNVHPDTIDAIVITHDHGDHTRGMGVFARKHRAVLYMTAGTRTACAALLQGSESFVCYSPGHPFRIGPFQIEPFLTAHDAADPVGLAVVEVGTGQRLGVATDLGRATVQTLHALSGADFLVLEANHDEELLQSTAYPWSVKNRIAGSHGHLSNSAAARIAKELLHPGLAGVLLAHLSAEANRPELARRVVGKALYRAGYKGSLEVARQDEPTPFYDVELLRRKLGPTQLSLF